MDYGRGNLCLEDKGPEVRGYGVDDKGLVELHCVCLRLRSRGECRSDVGHMVRPVEGRGVMRCDSYGWQEDLRGWATDN